MRIRYALWHGAAFVCLAAIVATQYVIVCGLIARFTNPLLTRPLTAFDFFVIVTGPLVYELCAGALLNGAFACWKRASKLRAAPRVTFKRDR